MSTTVSAPHLVGGHAEVNRGTFTLVLYSATIFVNAALLFAVEPMFSKMVLPLLGGTPSVWNTCMLFYQAALLAGYVYAFAMSRWVPLRGQLFSHLALLVLSLTFLPVAVAAGWTPPGGGAPIPWLILLLTVSLGPPFFLLSSGSPLLQRWFSYSGGPSADNPYFLYAASNLGSLIALLAYPLLLEPNLPLRTQSIWWSAGYWILVVLVGACGWFLWRATRAPANKREGRNSRGDAIDSDGCLAPTAGITAIKDDVSLLQRLRWVALAFAPSSLLLGVTTYLTTDIAPIPLLWVLPLALYLLSFVITFARRPIVRHEAMVGLQTFAVFALALVLALGLQGDISNLAPIHLFAFFATAMVCHGELVRTRPSVWHLTEFYVWISVGGLLGGVFNVLVAPVAFDTVVEYPIALIIACLLRPSKPTTHRRDRLLDFVLPALFAAAFVLLFRSPLSAYLGWAVTLAAAALYVLCCLAYLRRPLRFALGVAAVLVGLASATETDSTKLFDTRSFFGVHRVRAYATHHSLQHGTTAHGAQSTIPELRREPLMYFHREGPLGDVFANVLLDKPIRRVAIIGLGTGSIACYGRAQEHWTFYEIDPVVVEIASDPRYFSFMRDCAPRTDVVLGDARLSLNDTPDAEYDLIILDAFTSDAIPAHLMTREALALYLRKLAPGGSIVFHISNRYLRLEPVVARLAEDAQLAFVYRAHLSVTAEQRARYVSNSKWAVLSRSAADHADLARQPGWERLPTNGGVSLWTDDFSDILSVFSW